MDQDNKNFGTPQEPKVDQTVIDLSNASIQEIPNSTNADQVPKILKMLKIMKWTSIPLSIIQLLFILPMAYPLLVTIICPIGGFLAAHKLNLYLIKLYGIYVCLLIFIQILTMIILPGPAYIALQIIFMTFEIFVAIVTLRVAILMNKLDQDGWKNLKK